MMKKTKKIQHKIMVCMSVTLLISLVITGILTTLLNYNSIIDTLEQTISQSVYTVSERVHEELVAYGNISAELGHHETLSSNASQSKKEEVIRQHVELYGLERSNVVDVTGESMIGGANVSDRDYFQRSLKGETVISTPTVSKVSGELSIIISAPLYDEGNHDNYK